MELRARALRVASIIGTGAAGLLLAHELDYRLIVPDPEHRHDLLLRSGHGYLSKALFIAGVVGVLSLVATLALGAARARIGRAQRGRALADGWGHGPWSVAAFLALVQGGGFVVLESVERLVVGAPADDRLWLVTLTGVAVQILAAVAGAFLLALLERTGEVIGRRARRTFPRAGRQPRPTLRATSIRTRRPARALQIRGPPSLARS